MTLGPHSALGVVLGPLPAFPGGALRERGCMPWGFLAKPGWFFTGQGRSLIHRKGAPEGEAASFPPRRAVGVFVAPEWPS